MTVYALHGHCSLKDASAAVAHLQKLQQSTGGRQASHEDQGQSDSSRSSEDASSSQDGLEKDASEQTQPHNHSEHDTNNRKSVDENESGNVNESQSAIGSKSSESSEGESSEGESSECERSGSESSESCEGNAFKIQAVEGEQEGKTQAQQAAFERLDAIFSTSPKAGSVRSRVGQVCPACSMSQQTFVLYGFAMPQSERDACNASENTQQTAASNRP